METVDHHGRETAYRMVAGEDSTASVESAAEAGVRSSADSETAGEDEPEDASGGILYVHGSGATHRIWGHQYAPSGPAHPAVALDLSGHGNSEDVETDAGPETLSAYARDVVAVARESGARTLAGNSLGGAVVLWVALETNFDPARLILAGTGAKLAVRADLRRLLAEDFDGAIDALHEADLLFHDAPDHLTQRSRDEMERCGQAVVERDFLTCHQFDVRDRLDEIAVPALAIVGEHDGLTPPAYHEYLADKLPRCSSVVIDDAAHLAMAERPGAFNDALAAGLEEGPAP